ncbi:MAG: hypothetical protein ACK5GN_12700 [Pseudomonadota bacterium]|jgi:hypothetical protein
MKPATASDDNGAFSAQKSIFEFALRARKITILGALATQFHEISGLEFFCLLRRKLATPELRSPCYCE